MGQDSSRRSDTILSDMWVAAYRSYFRYWVNLAKTLQLTDEEAEDVVHTVIASALHLSDLRFESMDHLRNYVSRGVINRGIQSKQRKDRRAKWEEAVEIRFAVVPESVASDEQKLNDAFREAVRRLSKREFEIIKLRFYSGLTFMEISAMLGMPISTIKSRETLALRKMRDWLRKKGF